LLLGFCYHALQHLVSLVKQFEVQVSFLAAGFPTLIFQSLSELSAHPYSGNSRRNQGTPENSKEKLKLNELLSNDIQ